jgi:hypothetical protein
MDAGTLRRAACPVSDVDQTDVHQRRIASFTQPVRPGSFTRTVLT